MSKPANLPSSVPDNNELRLSMVNGIEHGKLEEMVTSKRLQSVVIDRDLQSGPRSDMLLLEAILRNPSVTELTFQDILITDSLSRWIVQALGHRGHLVTFRMVSVRIENDVVALRIAQMLRMNRTIKNLILKNLKTRIGGIGDIFAEYIAKNLGHSPELAKLILRDWGISARGAATLGKALKGCLSLNIFKLTSTTSPLVLNDSAHDFADALEVDSGLHTFALYGSETTIDASGALQLFAALETHTSLKTVVLGQISLIGTVSSAVGRFIERNTTVETLTLLGSFFQSHTVSLDNEITPIAQALAVSRSLKRLMLNGLGLSANDIEIFCKEGLDPNESLKSFYLRNNAIDTEGMEAIRQTVSRDTNLEGFDLSCNGLQDDPIVRFCRALAPNSTLKDVNLSGNRFHLTSLAGAIDISTFSLRVLSPCRNRTLDQQGIRALIDGARAFQKVASEALLDALDPSLAVDYLVGLGSGPARLLRHDHLTPRGLWSHILKKADSCHLGEQPPPVTKYRMPDLVVDDFREAVSGRVGQGPDMLFFFIKEKNDLLFLDVLRE